MPQMAPMFWMILYMLFFLTLLSVSVKLFFFSSTSKLQINKTMIDKNSLYWEW